MTITELCEMSLEELDAMSMPALEDYFRPFWPTTRPVPKPKVASSGIVSKEAVQNLDGSGKGKRRSRSTNPDQLAFENRLTPEKLKWLKENGVI